MGQFNLGTRQYGRSAVAQQKLLCWSGDRLFIEAGFNASKPLVRVNLSDGSVEEVDWLMYEGKSIADEVGFDPAERMALHFRAEGIRLIDLTSGQVFKVGWGDVGQWGLMSERQQPLRDSDVRGLGQHRDNWVSDSRYVVGFTTMPDRSKTGVVVLDVAQGKLEVTPIPRLTLKGETEVASYGNMQVIPGKQPGLIVALQFRQTSHRVHPWHWWTWPASRRGWRRRTTARSRTIGSTRTTWFMR